MTTSKPYIGVSGFMSTAEVRAALEAFPNCNRQLMVGVLASSKTIFGPGNSKPLRYPAPRNIAGIFLDDPRCLNLVHYGADNDDTLAFALRRAMSYGGKYCHGVQVNVPWPARDELEWFRNAYPEARVVLQIGPRALPAHGGEEAIADVVGKLLEYGDTITDVLIDVSGGEGVALDPARALPMIAAIHRALPELGLGIAGGLSAETLSTIAPTLARCPGLSIDAEGRLRDGAPRGGNLDLDKVRAYLAAAGRVVP